MPTKSIFTSKTIWSAALLFIISQAAQRGISLSDLVAPTGALVAKLIHDGPGFLSDLTQMLALGGVIAGRVTAAQKLHFVAPRVAAGSAASFGGLLIACGVLGGCVGSAVEPLVNPSANGLPAAVANTAPPIGTSAVTAASSTADLLKFAETVNNIVENTNAGLAVLAPTVASQASLAELVVHGPKETAILDKIVASANAVSSAAVAQNLPKPTVQAATSSVLTPTAAEAIVQQVQSGTPTP